MALGSVPVKVRGAGPCTVTVMGAVMVWGGLAESLAVTWTVVAPGARGVPVMVQPVLKARPAGRALPAATLHVYGPVPPVIGTAPV